MDLCHATAGGLTALPGLLAHHFFGIPLLVTEYGVRLRTHYLTRPDASPAVRSLLAAFHGRLTTETYRRAAYITPGNTHARRWQERCGADREKLRTVYPGMDAAPFAEAGSPRSARTRTPSSGSAGWNPPRTCSPCCTPSRRSARRSPGPGCGSSAAPRTRRASPTSATAGHWPHSSSRTRPTARTPWARTRSPSRNSAVRAWTPPPTRTPPAP
ncbi:hypothetical protein SHKM778_14900 [Streptomyces sp. KM77-8]|uniref:DUF3492 domain-containing protein n=1 Tax=Streptomyces haneummycinicus TaxID=3074435 RepID=A0AAT9HD21_9ACTN